MIMRKLSGFVGLAAVALAALAGTPASAAYPERPITIIVPWGAGGADAAARILATLMEQRLGVPVSVVNRTGGSGWSATRRSRPRPDGYTLGIVTVEIGMMHWQGLTDLTYEDYTPLALYNETLPGCRCAPTASGSGPGRARRGQGQPGRAGLGHRSGWHLAPGARWYMLEEAGIDPNAAPWVPTKARRPVCRIWSPAASTS